MRNRFVLTLCAAVALFAIVGTRPALAQQTPQTFTLQPGGRAVVSFQAFCIEFGKVFPNGIQGPSGLAPDPARAALSYGIGKGLTANEQQALQLQYGIWQALGAQNAPQGEAAAQDVFANGKTPPANPQGTSVLDAFNANQVKVTLNSWAPIGNKVPITGGATDNFYGQGQLTIENTSQQALTLYMPVGTQFQAINPAEQSVAAYATNVQVTNPQTTTSGAQNTLPNTSGTETYLLVLLASLSLLGLGFATHSLRHSLQ